MTGNFTMPQNGIFESSVVKLFQLSELTSFLNPWVITPPTAWSITPPGSSTSVPDSDFSHVTSRLHIPTVVLYTLLEQGVLLGFQYLAVQPWLIFFWTGVQHLIICTLAMQMFGALRVKELRVVTDDMKDDKLVHPKGLSWKKSASALWLLPPYVTAAMNNATLLLFAQVIQTPSRLQQHPNVRILEWFAVALFLGSRFGDWIIWTLTRRNAFLGQWRSFLVPLYSQVLLLGLRLVFRWFLEFPLLLPLQTLNPAELEQSFGLHRYQWVQKLEWLKVPPWVSYLLSGLAAVMALVNHFWWARAAKMVTEETEEQDK